MNLSEFRTRVARAVGMSTTDSGDLALVDAWINEGVLEFSKDAKVNQLTAALTATANKGDYTLDTDILALADLWYAPAGSSELMLEPVDSHMIQRMRRAAESINAATPRYYAMQGAHLLMLYPTPRSSSDTIHFLYVPRPAAMSLTSDSPSDATKGNIPEEYHSVIEAYAKWKAGQAEEHKPSQFGLAWQAEYEKGVAKTRSDMNRKAGVFKARKIGGGQRRRRFPVGRGIDDGS